MAAVRRVHWNPHRPDTAALDEVVRAIRGGRIVAIPTDTLYGLAVDPFQTAAVDRIFEVKGRSAERALPLIAADAEHVRDRLGHLTPIAERLAARFWPGPLTLLIAAPPALSRRISADTGKIGVRVPAHDTACLLCRACGIPLTATSANISGEAPSADPGVIARSLGDRIDLLVDAGTTPGGPPSTIVDAAGASPQLVREGAIAWEEIQACLRGSV